METNGRIPAEPVFLYEDVAGKIRSMIGNGTYRPGDRIPSIRGLAQQLRVSPNTVVQAYSQLENCGLVEARPQSGYYVRSAGREEGRRTPAAPAMEDVAPNDVILGDVPLTIMRTLADPANMPLGRGTPNTDLLPAAKLTRMLASESRRCGRQSVSYAPEQGLLRLRLQIARRMLHAGCSLSADDIVVTSGCVEAVTLALLTTCRAGDAVALASPIYSTFLKSVRQLGLRVLEIPSVPGEGINLDILEYAMKQTPIRACVTIANFNNPLGSSMPDDKKRDLVAMLARRDIPLIEDDVYGDLAFGPARPSCTKAFDDAGLVMYCSSFSKALAPGYRVGWMVPGRFRTMVEQLKSLFNLATASPTQLAVAEFLDAGGYDHHLRSVRRVYARHAAQMREAILRCFPEGTRVSRPAGGFMLWVELPEEIDSLKLYEQAVGERIMIAPGAVFTTTGRYGNCFRLNAAFWTGEVERAIETLGGLAGAMAIP